MDAHWHLGVADRAIARLHVDDTHAPGFRVGLSLMAIMLMLALTLAVVFVRAGSELPAGVPEPAVSGAPTAG